MVRWSVLHLSVKCVQCHQLLLPLPIHAPSFSSNMATYPISGYHFSLAGRLTHNWKPSDLPPVAIISSLGVSLLTTPGDEYYEQIHQLCTYENWNPYAKIFWNYFHKCLVALEGRCRYMSNICSFSCMPSPYWPKSYGLLSFVRQKSRSMDIKNYSYHALNQLQDLTGYSGKAITQDLHSN